MRYRPFGRTGLQGVGGGSSAAGRWPAIAYGAIEDGEAIKAIHRALDRGVNCVDTAPAYGARPLGGGRGARAREVAARDVILVTKCGVKVPPPGQLGPLRDSSRANILAEVDASLKRLRTDWVDVLPDPLAGRRARRSRRRMRALEEVVASGRARFVGVSNFTGRHAGRVPGHPARRRLAGGLSHARPARRSTETFPYCLANGIGVMGVWARSATGCSPAPSPPATDLRARRATGARRRGLRPAHLPGRQLSTPMSAWSSGCRREIAEPRGVSVSQLALAWVLGNPAISTALVVGARTPAEVRRQRRGRRASSSPPTSGRGSTPSWPGRQAG